MNKKINAVGFLSALVAGVTIFTSSALAFWPFDSLFGKGRVKAVTTEAKTLVAMEGKDARAQALFVNLKTMNAACKDVLNSKRKMFTEEETKNGSVAKPTAKPRPTVSPKELDAIYSSLAVKCKEILALSERLAKIYKGGEVSPTPTRYDDRITPTPVETETGESGGIFNLKIKKRLVNPKPPVETGEAE